MTAITGGNAKLLNVNDKHIIPIIDKLEEIGAKDSIETRRGQGYILK